MDIMTFGEVIFELRQQRKLTQIQFAEELMIDVKTLRRWEKGQTVPGFREIQRIAGILDVPENFLLTSAQQTAHESKNNEISIRQAKSQEPDTSLSLNEVKNQILTS
ncbi:MAG: helix-turn-helix transcriptional regulator [Erysipelotrichales bacterium]|nr:helix-turn-helix transcriptional regulator [Erysipelotrichales bacterium]